MPPPPLTDEEVRQCIEKCWEGGQFVWVELGMSGKTLPDDADLWLETVPSAYKWEWDQAYRFGLAEDAMANILTKLEAPANPHVQLAKVLSKEDMPRLLRTMSEMCDTEDISAWGILQVGASLREFPWWAVIPFAVSAVCFVLATVTSQPLWAMGGILCCVLGIATTKRVEDKAFRQLFERRINPRLTFYQLAEYIRDTAKIQAQEMQTAAQTRPR